MATTNNLGRVQGISLWVADGVVTTTGTITLTNSTMHPLINDNVVDTNGNVFKITAVSGTNPYTITTSGTPIYQLKGSEEEWDEVIEIPTTENEQVVSEDISSKLDNFRILLRTQQNAYIIVETSAWGLFGGGGGTSTRWEYCNDLYADIELSYTNYLRWGGVETTAFVVQYNFSTKTFGPSNFTLYGAYIKYKVVPLTAQQNSLYNLEEINAIATQEAENTYNFDNENFKNELQQKPHLVFLTINEHEFRGFFLEDNLYKHIDNVYQLNEETNEQELVKTFTCTIDLTNNLITYNENDIINTTKEEDQ